MRKLIIDNPIISAITMLLLSSLLAWGTWVTCRAFAQDKELTSHKETQKVEEKSITKAVEELKKEVSDFKREVKEDNLALRKDVVDNQKELLKLLIDIKRDGKK